MSEKINKISDSELKTKATEALSFAIREVNFHKCKKLSSELKTLFMKESLFAPSPASGYYSQPF